MERLSQVTVAREKQGKGSYVRGDIGIPDPGGTLWYICCPECGICARLQNHTITEHEDGTVTLSPSLLCPGVECGRCTAHYFIERNVIRWC